MCAVFPLHFRLLGKQNPFLHDCFVGLYASFSHFHTWISRRNVIGMKGFSAPSSPVAVSSRRLSCPLSSFLLHLHSSNLYSSVSQAAPSSPRRWYIISPSPPFDLSFLSPPLRLPSSQRDGHPADLPDWRERQRAGAGTPRGTGVRACAPQLQDQHHSLRRRRRPQRGALCLRAAFFPRQRSPQLDYFKAQR